MAVAAFWDHCAGRVNEKAVQKVKTVGVGIWNKWEGLLLLERHTNRRQRFVILRTRYQIGR